MDSGNFLLIVHCGVDFNFVIYMHETVPAHAAYIIILVCGMQVLQLKRIKRKMIQKCFSNFCRFFE